MQYATLSTAELPHEKLSCSGYPAADYWPAMFWQRYAFNLIGNAAGMVMISVASRAARKKGYENPGPRHLGT